MFLITHANGDVLPVGQLQLDIESFSCWLVTPYWTELKLFVNMSFAISKELFNCAVQRPSLRYRG